MTALFLKWTDEKLTWNASDYGGINTTFFGYKEVWVPEIILTNPSEKIDSFGKEWQRVRYNNDGKALWKPGTLVEATCSVNAYYFPFDVQECYLELFVWGYYASEVTFNENSNTIDTSLMPKHGTWNIIGTSVETNTVADSSIVRYYFRLQRKPQYLIINVILPILFLNLLNALVFVLPAESGERVSYSITVLLSIAVFMTIVSDILPRTSEPVPLISYCLLCALICSSLITVITVLNLRLFNKKEDDHLPDWLVKIYHGLERSCCKRRCGKRKVRDTGVKGDRVSFYNDKEDNHTIPRKTQMSIDNTGMHESRQQSFGVIEELFDSHQATWQDISRMIDFICLWMCAVVTVFSFCLFMIISKVSSN